jgi:Flp pilus assembly protein TadD
MLGGIALVLFASSLPQGAELIPFRVSEPEAARLVVPQPETLAPEPKLNDPAVDSLMREAIATMGAGHLAEARIGFVAVLQKDPEHLGALVNLGWIAQRQRAWGDAESYLKRAQKRQPDMPSVWLALGLVYLEQSKMDHALAAFAQVVALEPDNARAHRMFGLTLGRRGWYLGAEGELRRALELEPNDSGAHFNLAVVYLQRQPVALELARRHYYRSIELGSSPDSAIEALLQSPTEPPDAPKTSSVTR